MALMTCSLGVAAALASAVALYAASPHCRWPRWPRWRPGAQLAGALLAVLSLVAWCLALGPAVGLCGMLASWMLGMMVLPWLAMFPRMPDTHRAHREGSR
jgi:hypothetical protein